ncbi:MAG: response regulator [Desulfobacterales bacterium]|nr:response regulator [Desulfobacterales bacterium]
MTRTYNILIADRNSHVRDYMKREIASEGYQVMLAESGRDILKWIYSQAPIDLLVIDPDLPDANELNLWNKLCDRIPPLPIILHTLDDHAPSLFSYYNVVQIEKTGKSIERIKSSISRMLSPDRNNSQQG